MGEHGQTTVCTCQPPLAKIDLASQRTELQLRQIKWELLYLPMLLDKARYKYITFIQIATHTTTNFKVLKLTNVFHTTRMTNLKLSDKYLHLFKFDLLYIFFYFLTYKYLILIHIYTQFIVVHNHQKNYYFEVRLQSEIQKCRIYVCKISQYINDILMANKPVSGIVKKSWSRSAG